MLEHREHLEAEGSLEVRRARQQQDWMWAMVDAHLHDAVRDATGVRAERAAIEHAVRAGELSAVDGTARILDLYVDDLRAHRPERDWLDHGPVDERLRLL